jgi:hypothetical protein
MTQGSTTVVGGPVANYRHPLQAAASAQGLRRFEECHCLPGRLRPLEIPLKTSRPASSRVLAGLLPLLAHPTGAWIVEKSEVELVHKKDKSVY